MIDNETLQNDLAREKYLRDLDKLYASVREWLREIDPDATTDQNARARIQGLREGDYQAPILTIHRRPKDADFALVPRGFDVSGGDGFVRAEGMGWENLFHLPDGDYWVWDPTDLDRRNIKLNAKVFREVVESLSE
jgi:hypothetical protein